MTVPAKYTLTEAHFIIAELEAERDEALANLRAGERAYDNVHERARVQWVRAEAAEAERDEMKQAQAAINAQNDRLREALRGKCDCGHIHDRDNGCDDCSCWGWSCAALAAPTKEGT